MDSELFRIGLVGATGAVGTEVLKVLEDRRFPVGQLRAFASAASAGKSVLFKREPIALEVANAHSFDDIDIAIFSAGSAVSKEMRPWIEQSGCVMIDNSSAFRMEGGVPLIIPEINSADLKSQSSVIAVPNCSTIIMLMAVAPLRKLGRIKRIVVSTYQAVSGAGAKAMRELETQTMDVLSGLPAQPKIFPYQIAFNLFAHNTEVNDAGYNQEEWKMINETKKILHDPEIHVTATCVRVPILRAHSESINVEFYDPRPSLESIRSTLEHFPGVKLVDDRAGNHFPMPSETAGQYDVHVGHVRNDVSNPNAIDLFASGDQLLKGAALDAVEIAEALVEMKLLRRLLAVN